VAGEDTQALWLEFARTKDKALRDRLILTYAPLVKYVAGRLGSGLPAHVDEGDLVSYGLLGLIGAIERYDPTRDIKFETYALRPLPRPRDRARDRRARGEDGHRADGRADRGQDRDLGR
jgi:DNA-directed RNA polymerase specialized sigma subunit